MENSKPKESRRVKMTKMCIKTAMLELLESNPLNKISVTDVCKAADVNRSTFYAYYEDVQSLVYDIESDILNQLPASAPMDIDTDERFAAELENFLEFIKANKSMFNFIMIHLSGEEFTERQVKYIAERYQSRVARSDNLRLRYSYAYCIYGTIGLIKDWIKASFPLSCRDLAVLLIRMYTRVRKLDSVKN
ncbi:MAG: TetR/AcrR family transcriptional regulator [Clostridia bacterium]|nr:TetR/AcrR family transcriptional regulator [Clostridia bacterium]